MESVTIKVRTYIIHRKLIRLIIKLPQVEYAKSLGLGGAMIWSIETDDFYGKCGQRYPILRAINSAFQVNRSSLNQCRYLKEWLVFQNVVPSEAPLPPTSSEPAPSSTEAAPPIPEGVCQAIGYVRDPNDCARFYYCFQTDNGFLPIEFSCSEGLYFDTESHICNYQEFVECNEPK